MNVTGRKSGCKDRKGRKPTYQDITHYRKIIVPRLNRAPLETGRLMGAMDKCGNIRG